MKLFNTKAFIAGMLFGLFSAGIGGALAVPLIVATNSPAPASDPQPHYLPVCEKEDGGPELPCVWRDQTTGGQFILYTVR